MRRVWRVVVAGVLWLLAPACGKLAPSDGVQLESNTNWLALCSSDAECLPGLACLCGMCSLPCEEGAACGALDGARCGSGCAQSAASTAMCVFDCSASADCGAGFECADFECHPLAAAPGGGSWHAGEVAVPAETSPQTPGACEHEFISMDVLYERALADLMAAPEASRPYLRYASLANRTNAGACAGELSTLQSGLVEALNLTSLAPRVRHPRAIEGGLVRIDLRDFAWERPVIVGERAHGDVWEAVIERSPFALALVGPEADVLTARTQTSVPLFAADALIAAALEGELYTALIGLPGTLEEFFAGRGVDAEGNRRTGAARRAGTTRSLMSRLNRFIERQPLGDGTTGAWLAFDFDAGSERGSRIIDPIDVRADGGTLVFPLPNGLPAYGIFDELGQIVPSTQLILDANEDDFSVRSAVSCLSCHVSALAPVTDEVRGALELDPNAFAGVDASAVRALFPPAPEWDQLWSADSARFDRARSELGLTMSSDDPAALSARRFGDTPDLATRAGDLMLPLAAASDELTGPLGESRAAFGASFHQHACRALANRRNTPRACPR